MEAESQKSDPPAQALPSAGVTPDVVPRRRRAGWLGEGARVLVFRAPRWEGLDARPLTLAVLVLASYLAAVLLQWSWAVEPARLQWTGFLSGWIDVALTGWLCWVVTRSARTGDGPRPSTATLMALLWSASLVSAMVEGLLHPGLSAALGPEAGWAASLQWSAWLVPMAWAGLVQIVLLWRVAQGGVARVAILLITPIPLVIGGYLAPTTYWITEPPPDAAAEVGLPLTDEVINTQSQLLATALAGLQAPRPGRINVYAATFAPYASEDVFMRESAVVARTMRERFGADGRLVELVANRATSSTLPWGTPANLRQTIQRMAAVMDREHDVLFLHLTSHGCADGKLANDTWPLQTEPMTPELLKRWLDEAGVRWRVISISACYSGSWIAPLAGDGTLVMTAADADHTSYGCGKRSELTFFGRAMYEEALRKTWSFTEAHAFSRKVIEVREQEAGKSDGFSNPQISEGAGVRGVLERLESELSGKHAE
ncbi:C13 family peptidase [Roseateles sp.]|uniref:C13 family peptidase n=1 Tax=Roseateles sp. TaxID=1971397 RepID=UPI0032672B97